MKKKLLLLLVPATLCIAPALWAQSANVASAAEATGTGGSYSYSIGQVAYTFQSSPDASVSEGVQQPYFIRSVGVIRPDLEFSMDIYPNPTTSDLTLSIRNQFENELTYRLMDALGHRVMEGIIQGPRMTMNTGSLPASIYYLNICKDDQSVRTFRIVKY
jgi:opacity protein-like surface antigen